MKTYRRVLICVAAVALTAGCTRMVGGFAQLPATEFPGPANSSVVDVDHVLLNTARMRGITGAGENLTIIPTMDGKYPVDIEDLARSAPTECRFVFADTATFGSDFAQFHKTTFQYPTRGALISEGAASYTDSNTARRVFDTLVGTAADCAADSVGAQFVGGWTADAEALHTRTGGCGRDYRVKSVVLLEVTFCGFPDSVPDILMANMAANVPNA